MSHFPKLLCIALACLTLLVPDAPAQDVEPGLEPILRRYRDSLGGNANFSRIHTVRIEAEIFDADGKPAQQVTVMKKKPNRVRTTTFLPGGRIVQGFDGTDAWVLVERHSRSYLHKMTGSQREEFIRSAPIENPLINPVLTQADLSRGEDIRISHLDCYVVIATFPDGARQVVAFDKEEFHDRRIWFYDTEGNRTAEIIPSNFEIFGGIVFAMRILRRDQQGNTTTMEVRSVDLNLGLLDSLFQFPGAANLQ